MPDVDPFDLCIPAHCGHPGVELAVQTIDEMMCMKGASPVGEAPFCFGKVKIGLIICPNGQFVREKG